MGKLTIQELQAIRERAKRARNLREGIGRAKITVHMGTCGIASGAREVLNALMEEIERRGIDDVLVTTSGCAGLCSREPMATVELAGQPPVKYVDLTPKKIVEILLEHAVGGAVKREYALAVGSERTH
jgi:NADP-reducing hydrogenase subunit HndB